MKLILAKDAQGVEVPLYHIFPFTQILSSLLGKQNIYCPSDLMVYSICPQLHHSYFFLSSCSLHHASSLRMGTYFRELLL